ncbi:MAG: succinate dehydrogenase/fumarate reductase iron-sulfur subunit [Lachnospiraceae bacterium]|nr:succinate dehydrogenase/fumarate reductase iron-sulfur subunit [Lachnospiraceae bacterium]
MRIKILRRQSSDTKPYWQEFNIDKNNELSIAGVLEQLNSRDELRDVEGVVAKRIEWECSCMQGMCGACAMVINKRPALACEVFLRDIKTDTITLEPLSKFPTIRDLVVDRSIIEDNLRKVHAYIEEFKGNNPKIYDQMYSVGKCLKCGLCLEVCPNYKSGKNFFGTAFAHESFLIASRSKTREEDIRKSYTTHFETGCSKSLSCSDVCPMNIKTIASIGRMNKGK